MLRDRLQLSTSVCTSACTRRCGQQAIATRAQFKRAYELCLQARLVMIRSWSRRGRIRIQVVYVYVCAIDGRKIQKLRVQRACNVECNSRWTPLGQANKHKENKRRGCEAWTNRRRKERRKESGGARDRLVLATPVRFLVLRARVRTRWLHFRQLVAVPLVWTCA